MRSRHAIVIGGGVIGLCCAYSLAKRDHRVTVLDAVAPGSGASEGNAGWVTPSLSGPVPAPGIVGESLRRMVRADSPLYIKPTLDPRRLAWLLKLWRNCNESAYRAGLAATARLNERTFDLFDRLHDDGVEFEMHRAGLLFCFLGDGKRDAVADDLRNVAHLGYRPRFLDRDELRSFEPGLSSSVRNGLFIDQERQVRPESLVTGLVKRLLDLNVDIRPAAPVDEFATWKGRVVGVPTWDGVIEADDFVIAAGAHSGRLARKVGVRVPIEAGKGYSLHHEPAPVDVSHALYLYESRIGVTPLDGALRLAGTMEFSGINTQLRGKRVDAISDAAGKYLSGWAPESPGKAWAGMRPMTPDGLPVIGRLGRHDNVTIASGHAMLGVTLAPATGEVVGDLLVGKGDRAVLAPFDPARFTR